MRRGLSIFVFGSNTQGRHGKGAALTARRKHGAIYGQAYGLQGNSYAIVTKELRSYKPAVSLKEIEEQVIAFLKFARAHTELTFMVTPIGCGLAGFTPAQIAPMFVGRSYNVHLPAPFLEVLDQMRMQGA